MAIYSDFGTIAKDANFQSRVAYALATQAIVVFAEVPTTPGHGARVAYARLVLVGAVNIQPACSVVLTDATIMAEANVSATPQFGITDPHIQAAVATLWDDFSR
jgi:hypothetical protein